MQARERATVSKFYDIFFRHNLSTFTGREKFFCFYANSNVHVLFSFLKTTTTTTTHLKKLKQNYPRHGTLDPRHGTLDARPSTKR